MPPNDDEGRRGLLEQMALGAAYANQTLANQQAALQAQTNQGLGPGYQTLEQYQAQQQAASQLRGQAARNYQTQLMGEQERGLRGWLPIATGAIGAMPRRAGVNREPRRTFGGSGMWGPEPQERVAAKAPEPPRPPPIPRYERLLGEDIFGEDDE